MDRDAKLNLPIAIVKVKTSKFDHTSEIFLDTNRDQFLRELIGDMEFQYGKGFDQVYKKLDKNDKISEAQYISHNTDSDDSIIDLIVLFQDKKVLIFPQTEPEKSEDLDNDINTVIYENWLHGSIRITGQDNYNEEYTLGIVGKEKENREDRKKSFLSYIRQSNTVKFQKEFLQESKILDKDDYLIEATYRTADDDLKILVRFLKKNLKVRVKSLTSVTKNRPEGSPILASQILEDDHLVHLDKLD